MTILVIVESPAKCKKIQSYLGPNYIVQASYGHICNLNKKLGLKAIDINNHFTPKYINSKEKSKIISSLQNNSKKCEEVIIASDLDREGEAIGYHLVRILGLDIKKTKRIVFNEISKKAIVHAVNNYTYLDINKIHAQQARQIIDYLIGFSISPLLWKYVTNKLSAGRCQSAALLLLYNKYKTFTDYKESCSFTIKASFNTIGECSSSYTTTSKQKIIDICTQNKTCVFTIKNMKESICNMAPPKPFITSTIQQEASNKLKFSPKKTMALLQSLYEGGHITYMRTDSYILSNDILDSIKNTVGETYGESYHNRKEYKNKDSNCQEAHECIRPVHIDKHNLAHIDSLDTNQKKLYELIWKRTIASQMIDNKKKKIKITIGNDTNKLMFTTTLEKDMCLGYQVLYKKEKKDTITNVEKKIVIGKIVRLDTMSAQQTYNSSIQMYSEATLIKDLEKKGIGRPSTYSNIIETLYKRKYIQKKSHKGTEKKIECIVYTHATTAINYNKKNIYINAQKNKLFITDIGIKVMDFMQEHFDNIINETYTSDLEKKLDNIYSGNSDWISTIQDNYDMYVTKVNELKKFAVNKDKRLVGVLPDTQQKIYAYLGKYGNVAQVGEDGTKTYYSIPDDISIASLTIQNVIELIEKKEEKNKQIVKELNPKISIRNGQYGPYIMNKLKKVQFIPIPKEKQNDLQSLTLKDCKEIIKNYVPKKKVYKKYPKKNTKKKYKK